VRNDRAEWSCASSPAPLALCPLWISRIEFSVTAGGQSIATSNFVTSSHAQGEEKCRADEAHSEMRTPSICHLYGRDVTRGQNREKDHWSQ
jgi:hypothetical protein